MPSQPSVVATIIVSLVLAYGLGLAARVLRLPPLVGYLVAGVILGPFTPGFTADQHLIDQLAEIGVALLLFGVGLHFSLRDLAAVWRVAVPGAILQIAASAALGYGVARLLGFASGEAAMLGASLSVASTVVATRALAERGRLQTVAGRVALGWLVVQDLVVVCVLVLLPGAGGGHPVSLAAAAAMVGLQLLEVVMFVAAMLILGRRIIPWLLELTARDGSHELFRLAVIAVALGIAYLSSALLGVSLALGAFFAGVVIADSDVSHQAAGESLPVQQVFTVLFFVSVGMLFDPFQLVRSPFEVAGIAASVIVGNCLVTLLILLALRTAPRDAAQAAAALAQIGEFSFILSSAAVARGLMSAEGRSLVLGAALLSILVQPLMFRAMDAVASALDRLRVLRRWNATQQKPTGDGVAALSAHAVLVGYGRVGGVIGAALRGQRIPYIVIEQNLRYAELMRREGIAVVYGDAAWPEVLDAAKLDRARLLVIAIPDRRAARRIIARARQINPAIDIVVRTHTGDEADWLAGQAVGRVVMGELHTAREMADYALDRFLER